MMMVINEIFTLSDFIHDFLCLFSFLLFFLSQNEMLVIKGGGIINLGKISKIAI
jgi:hypothetical protein